VRTARSYLNLAVSWIGGRELRALENGTTLLFGLPGVAVARVDRAVDGGRVVHVVTDDPAAACCPDCGTVSRSVKGNVTTRPKDLPYGETPLRVVWHKRRWRCRQARCERGSFTEQLPELPAGARTTGRMRQAAARAVTAGRSVAEVAAAHGISWPTVQRAVDAHAREVLREPEPTPLLGIDETRFGAVRWIRRADSAWIRLEPWETGFVDLRCPRHDGGQGLLGQVDGRTGTSVISWLAARSQAFRDAIEVVALDPSAPYAAAVRQALPAARIAVDHFHLVLLANQAVTRVRQRVTRELLDRRGRAIDPVWANRRLLLRGAERLSPRALRRMWNGLIDNDPTGEILTAWIAKEELRRLLHAAARGGHRHEINTRLYDFYTWCADADIPELTTLAETIETWWPAVLVFLHTQITNARTEGFNRQIKHIKRAAYGFRNRDNYRRRVRLHCTRSTRPRQAGISPQPGQG
jgi:transposase